MYSISDYDNMIADRLRMDAYIQALRQSVKPGSVVLDIGTGTGVFALLACQFGARRVYAIEPDDAIQVARETAAANGYAERITFIQELSTHVTLPEPADVLISDLRGVLPLFQHHIPSIADARTRLLAPGGALIPQRDTVWAALVQAPALYRRQIGPWDGQRYGFDMQAARRVAVNAWCKGRVTPEQCLTEPQCWATLDYATIDNPDISTDMTWTVAQAGTAHGLSVWFDTALAAGVHLTNAPGEPELIYGSGFFPYATPISLAVGDTVSVTLQAHLVDADYIWRWTTCVLSQGDPRQMKASFDQSTLLGVPLAPAQLRKRAESYRPMLHEDGHIDRLILGLMDGDPSLADIAHRVSRQFPTRFATWQDALTRVGELSQKYSR